MTTYVTRMPHHEDVKDTILGLADDLTYYKRYKNCNVDVADVVSSPYVKFPAVEEFILIKYKEFYQPTAPVRTRYWLNRYLPGYFQEPHDHTDTNLMSWCYFVDVPENSGKFLAHVDSETKVAYGDEGTVVFFPSTMVHEVTPNASDRVRYTVAGNIVLC